MASEPRHRAMIVAHGQPSDPAPAEADLARLAAAVAAYLPDWLVTSATLATEGALASATTGPRGFVYPMFMAGGWFTKTHLPDRLSAAGAGAWHILAPFGLDPDVQALTVTIAQEACKNHSLAQTEVLLAAHGSFRSSAPSDVAFAMVGTLQTAGFARVGAGFIDQSPRIAEIAASFGPQAICLPFFAAKGGHVVDDLPKALAEAGFAGQLLQPVGLDPRVPALIAEALQKALHQATVAASG